MTVLQKMKLKMRDRTRSLILGNRILRSWVYFIPNYYKTSFEKNVLICYICVPFRKKGALSNHTNWQESLLIASLFKELGYNVDIVEYNVDVKVRYAKYDVIFGFGDVFESSFYDQAFQGKRIYYTTVSCVYYQNRAEIDRIRKVNKERNIRLLPQRITPQMWSLSLGMSDALITIGNSWTRETYEPYVDCPIYQINVTSLAGTKKIKRNIAEARKRFLWFGSAGLVHKGLDLCLNFFSKRPDLELYFCGIYESDFFEAFQDEIKSPNIHFCGFVNVNSESFVDLATKCMFSILPSCSEGQATSLLTTMAVGMIPVATVQTGIDIQKLGVEISDTTVDAIRNAVAKTDQYSEPELILLSENAMKTISDNHSLERFSNQISSFVKTILGV